MNANDTLKTIENLSPIGEIHPTSRQANSTCSISFQSPSNFSGTVFQLYDSNPSKKYKLIIEALNRGLKSATVLSGKDSGEPTEERIGKALIEGLRSSANLIREVLEGEKK